MQIPVRLLHHSNTVPFTQLVQIELPVLPARALAVGQDATARHHYGATPHIGHRGWEVQGVRVVRGHADFDRSTPLVHQFIDPDLKQFVVSQRTMGHHHTVVELVQGSSTLSRPVLIAELYQTATTRVES